mmetsp:Transcript_40701/g.81606  ORF Transcript_40701/g.81606 Transcript_40701/m.81606 type:complete len:255 (+) Transcript_40701:2279-3043(+)
MGSSTSWSSARPSSRWISRGISSRSLVSTSTRGATTSSMGPRTQSHSMRSSTSCLRSSRIRTPQRAWWVPSARWRMARTVCQPRSSKSSSRQMTLNTSRITSKRPMAVTTTLASQGESTVTASNLSTPRSDVLCLCAAEWRMARAPDRRGESSLRRGGAGCRQATLLARRLALLACMCKGDSRRVGCAHAIWREAYVRERRQRTESSPVVGPLEWCTRGDGCLRIPVGSAGCRAEAARSPDWLHVHVRLLCACV